MRGTRSAPRKPAVWPELGLPLRPPYDVMEAERVRTVPLDEGWQFEPKWDGFRCLAFKDGSGTVVLQSKAGQPLGRYFPEMEAALAALPLKQFVLDGELVIPTADGLSFDDLLQRIHPAASRVKTLAARTPSVFLVFDLLVDGEGRELATQPLEVRRAALEKLAAGHFEGSPSLQLSPTTKAREEALAWLGAPGMDGVIAKRRDAAYASGLRTAMVKVKPQKTVDCVVGGFRWASDKTRGVGSLLLGLYDDEGHLDHVGFCSSFDARLRAEVSAKLLPLQGGEGFTGKAPGGPSRWSDRSGEWEPLTPSLVVEVGYDYFNGGRFRHGTEFFRWRVDKAPHQCTYAQLEFARPRQVGPPGLPFQVGVP